MLPILDQKNPNLFIESLCPLSSAPVFPVDSFDYLITTPSPNTPDFLIILWADYFKYLKEFQPSQESKRSLPGAEGTAPTPYPACPLVAFFVCLPSYSWTTYNVLNNENYKWKPKILPGSILCLWCGPGFPVKPIESSLHQDLGELTATVKYFFTTLWICWKLLLKVYLLSINDSWLYYYLC